MPIMKKGGWKKEYFRKYEKGDRPGTIGNPNIPFSGKAEEEYGTGASNPIFYPEQKKKRKKDRTIYI